MGAYVAFGRDRGSRSLFLTALCACLALAWQVPSQAQRMISRVDVRSAGQDTIIALVASDGQPVSMSSFALDNPPRLVFDLPGVKLDPSLAPSLQGPTPGIVQVRLGQFQVEPDVARVVVDLNPAFTTPDYEATKGREPGETLIVLRGRGATLLQAPQVTVEGETVMLRVGEVGLLPRVVGTLDDPFRIYADITGAVVESSLKQEIGKGSVREMRLGQQPEEGGRPVARLVVELNARQAYSFACEGTDLVVAIGPDAWALPLPEYRAAGRLKGRVIVVDPGHGGRDTGAAAVLKPERRGPYEKDLVLDMGLRLARILEAEGAKVTMTRSDDTFVELKERAAIANRLGADVMVSIHCNSCDEPGRLSGTSVYYDHSHSEGLARLVQHELVAALGTSDKGVRNANFAVIRRAVVPGILVEVAYVNHPEDLRRLVHPNFRERAARAMAEGVIKFLAQQNGGARSG